MARANNGGWNFIKVGETYQYKEDSLIAMITILEDTSDEENYKFKVKIEKATYEPPEVDDVEIYHAKNPGGFWSGMTQIYEGEEYSPKYNWMRTNN